MPMRRNDLTVSFSPSTAAASAPSALGGNGISTMDGGDVLGGGKLEPLASKVLVVIVVPVSDVVFHVVDFPDI